MRNLLTLLFGFLLASLTTVSAVAQERITAFNTLVEVEKSGALVITETISVVAEGDQIKRGIFRELPRYYKFMGVTLENDYEFISVKRNNIAENRAIIKQDNAVNLRIGHPSYFLENGGHTYEIKYRIPEQVRRHRDDSNGVDRDEVYWNATGTYWDFPIGVASATLIFPEGSEVIDTSGYTGRFGSRDKNYTVDVSGNRVKFITSQQLGVREGLSVSASIKPGIIAPMSEDRKQELNWIRNGGVTLLGLGGLTLFLYYISMWRRVGRDPIKPPVFPRYEPPTGYSAAAVHHIHFKGFRKMDALTATLMSLSMKDVLDIHAAKKKTTLQSMLANRDTAGLHRDERKLLDLLFGDKDKKIVIDGKSDKTFFRAVTSFTRHINDFYSRDYHRANAGWGVLGIVLSLIIVAVVMSQPVAKSGPIFLGLILGIVALNIVFLILLRAPTKKGAQISSEIDGFKLYLETAEEKRINTANPIGQKPPLMTVKLYEKFLPYAVALGVEKPWTKQFEDTLPEVAKTYEPSYARGPLIESGGNPFKASTVLAAAMTAGVAAAAPVSQSSSSGGFSSGSSGGGSSGGGGGGGGGGGW